MKLKEVWDIQYPSREYVPQTFLLYYIIRVETNLRMMKLGVLREEADDTINKTESLPDFERWCTEEDLKEAFTRLLKWSYHCT